MKQFLVFWFLFAMGIGGVFAQKLTIQVENADIGQGYLMIGVFNDEENFPNNYFRREKVDISDNVMAIVFDNLPFGQYAVSVYQDSNNNQILDKGIFGIPKEKYGFSNNASRPNYKKCLFDFNGDMTIKIKL
jgi:uncharacterized protein (DUF2141 family)